MHTNTHTDTHRIKLPEEEIMMNYLADSSNFITLRSL